jgi:hypothetical protein
VFRIHFRLPLVEADALIACFALIAAPPLSRVIVVVPTLFVLLRFSRDRLCGISF